MLCDFLIFVLGNKGSFRKQVGFELTLEEEKAGLASQAWFRGSHIGPHTQRRTTLGLMLCFAFSFCTGPHKLHRGAVSRGPSGREKVAFFKQRSPQYFRGSACSGSSARQCQCQCLQLEICGQEEGGGRSKRRRAKGLQCNTKGCGCCMACTKKPQAW